MNEIIIKIIPVILIFVLGYFLKTINLLKKEDGDLFLKVVFYISLPALIVLSIANITLSLDFIYLPLIAVLIIFITCFIARFIGGLFHLQKTSLGVFLVGSMIMNVGFTLPFIISAYGGEGLARISLFDIGNALLVYTFIYYIAYKYGSAEKASKTMIKKFILAMPIWALVIAIIINLTSLRIPSVADNFLQIIGNITIPLIMLSLGIYFSPKVVKFLPLISAIVIRMGVGLLLGLFFVALFNLEGLTRLIVLLGSAAPVGYNTLTFSSLENLDKEFAASLVSFSILIGIFFIPILIFVLA